MDIMYWIAAWRREEESTVSEGGGEGKEKRRGMSDMGRIPRGGSGERKWF